MRKFGFALSSQRPVRQAASWPPLTKPWPRNRHTGSPKIVGTFWGGPIKQDYSIFSSTLGSLIQGNHHRHVLLASADNPTSPQTTQVAQKTWQPHDLAFQMPKIGWGYYIRVYILGLYRVILGLY